VSIYGLRTAIADELKSVGIRAFAEAPKALSGSAAIVDPADPYITAGTTFGRLTAHFTVTLLVNPSPNWEQEVEEMISTAIEALYDSEVADWDLTGVSLFDTLQLTNVARVFKGAQIQIAADVAIKELNN